MCVCFEQAAATAAAPKNFLPEFRASIKWIKNWNSFLSRLFPFFCPLKLSNNATIKLNDLYSLFFSPFIPPFILSRNFTLSTGPISISTIYSSWALRAYNRKIFEWQKCETCVSKFDRNEHVAATVIYIHGKFAASITQLNSTDWVRSVYLHR